MTTINTFLKKSALVLATVTGCFHLISCDSSKDYTYNPSTNFDLTERYNKEILDENLGELATMPRFLLSGDKILFENIIAADTLIDGELIDDNLETAVRSSGQVFLGNFRFDYNNRFQTDDNVGFLIRSADHNISGNDIGDNEGDFVDSLIQLRDTGFGSGSLAEALLVDASKISTNPDDPDTVLINFTEAQLKTIQNAIKSLGHEADDDLRVLVEQIITFEADSTNQLLVDENKITGIVTITRIWREVFFEFTTTLTIEDIIFGNEGQVEGEYTITLKDSTTEVTQGTFEIQLNSL